ncbi:thioesterase family protein [Endozoicomonas sp. GU-1]|uniref:acyl-CoA thioesterase n=1 Tax=Endozoicomonas sp. GU-1 TaxID=3009078 RepID=UPI0022B2B822|nr:thioesterase family protein [Endozoicomonas sp. GU-1]WBA81288.1 thioesterase family protein [Endozoicomonas sp. GU-1]WBA84233.1 thioesterase family protein [Endozoicomonas sp. GU-1]
MQRTLFNHFYQDTVRWGDCDPLGHLNNAAYMRLIESARLDYFFNILKIELKPDSEQGWVMRGLNCEFNKQLHYPTQLETGTRFSKVGNSSAILEAAIYRKGEEQPVFTASVPSIWCNYKKGISVRIPDTIRKAIKDYEVNVEGL